MPLAFSSRLPAAVLVSSLTVGCAASTATSPLATPALTRPSPAPRASFVWPQVGQASYALDGQVLDSPDQQPAAIASVAKVMTAYLAVHVLAEGDHVVIRASDVFDTRRRKSRGESVIDVVQGEVLTRNQALTALLLPSANNIAVVLARRVAGSRSAFVAQMNQTARALGMTHTAYTDPSGYSDSTVSTAHDQLLLLRAALHSKTLVRIMGTKTAFIPVAGRVVNTNSLLGRNGFIAGKTGSTSAAGGCLVFRVVRGDQVLDGVVLGQRGSRLIDAVLLAASDLARDALRRNA